MYGSNFCIVTLYPRAFKSRPRDAAVIPFPRPETTPPVTKTYFTAILISSCFSLLIFSFPSQVSLKGNVACRRHLYDESQLLRACVAPVTADNIRNSGYRPTYSCRLARPISMNSLMQAWLIHSCCPGLSFKIKNDYNTSRISCNFFLLFFIIFDIFHEILNFCTIFYTYHDFLDIIRKNEYDNQCF